MRAVCTLPFITTKVGAIDGHEGAGWSEAETRRLTIDPGEWLRKTNTSGEKVPGKTRAC